MKYPDFMDYNLAISIGLDGHEVVNVNGTSNLNFYNGDSVLFISSSSDLDDYNNEGAQVVQINFLTDNYNESSIEIELNGQQPIELDSIHRINSIEVVQAGEYRSNDGKISIYDFDRVYHEILPGQNKSSSCNYSVPLECCGYIYYMQALEQDNFDVYIEEDGILAKVFSFTNFMKFKVPYKVLPGSDIIIKSENGSRCMYQLVLIEEVI